MPIQEDTTRRKAAAMLFAKLGLALALPLALIGAGIWWYLGAAVQTQALDAQATSHTRVVQAAIGDSLIPFGDGEVAVFAWEDINAEIDSLLRPGIGLTNIRLLDTGGGVIFSTNPEDIGRSLQLRDVDKEAFAGSPTAAARVDADSTAPVAYVLPLFLPGNDPLVDPVAAIAHIEVVDDTMYSMTRDARSSLAIPAAGALGLTWLVLIALSWWQVRDVRKEATTNRQMAMSDSLTGLANRMRFHERLDEALAAAERSPGQMVGLLMLDLDGFKAINDTGGHAAGDRLLRRVSAKLEEATRLHESACRLGGDEFAIVVPQMTSREELVAVADRLHKELDLTVDFNNGRSLRVSASIGLAVYPEDADNSDDLVSHADVGMYNVKASRRAKMQNAGVHAGR